MRRFDEIKQLILEGKIKIGTHHKEISLLLGEPSEYTHKQIQDNCKKPQCWKFGDVEIHFYQGKVMYSQVEEYASDTGEHIILLTTNKNHAQSKNCIF